MESGTLICKPSLVVLSHPFRFITMLADDTFYGCRWCPDCQVSDPVIEQALGQAEIHTGRSTRIYGTFGPTLTDRQTEPKMGEQCRFVDAACLSRVCETNHALRHPCRCAYRKCRTFALRVEGPSDPTSTCHADTLRMHMNIQNEQSWVMNSFL